MNAPTAFRPRKDTSPVKLRLAAIAAVVLLSACRHAGDVTSENGGGIYSIRSACPIAGIPAGTGDITLFNPPSSTDSRAIDVSATISDLRTTCQDSGNDVISTATFTVVALRRDAGPARQVVLNFAAGDLHGWARVQATVRVNRGAATLPANVRAILTRPRKAGEAEAAIDPLADPAIR